MFLVLVLLLLCPAVGWCQHEDEDAEYRPGLIASYSSGGGKAHLRMEDAPSIIPSNALPHPLLRQGKLTAAWSGLLLSAPPGEYRLHIYAAGDVRVSLLGKTVITGSSETGDWFASEAIELEFGYHDLKIGYKQISDTAKLGLYWSGPTFGLEPIAPRFFFHDPRNAPDGKFERGQLLARALRCAACHDIPGDVDILPAPSLAKLTGNISPEWLARWLIAEHGDAAGLTDLSVEDRSRRMPYFGLNADQAEAIAAFLLRGKATTEIGRGSDEPATKQGDQSAGERLFTTLGCLACHRVGDVGTQGLFGGGDLTQIADKRPQHFFQQWLENPATLNADHRMPVFDLSDKERKDLAAYLNTLHRDQQVEHESTVRSASSSQRLIEQGERLFTQHRCAACHALDDDAKPIAKARATLNDFADPGCLAEPDAEIHRPGYLLAESDRAALQTYVTAMLDARSNRTPAARDPRMLLIEQNCTACHARGTTQGIAAHLPALVENDPKLSTLVAGMSPPPLYDIGDKLHDDALVAAITRRGASRRPWMSIRMPRFRLNDTETKSLVKYFVQTDRIPDPPEGRTSQDQPANTALELAGSRLVTADGFGCTSCHQIGQVIPQGVALNARGPDLSLLGERIRRPWYDRWVRNPARIVPRMEMPSVQLAVRGVLGDNLDHQLAAVWDVLNREGFKPPEAGALRTVRASGLPNTDELAAVLTDVLESPGHKFIKPLLIGLPNRHNILFDLQTSHLAGWWIGDTARQRTRGKTWYWETAGAPVQAMRMDSSDLVLVETGERLQPLLSGQFPTEFDVLEHVKGGVRFAHRLRFGDEREKKPATLRVTQTFEPIFADGESHESGVRRQIQIEGQAGDALDLRIGPADRARLDEDSRVVVYESPGQTRIRVITGGTLRVAASSTRKEGPQEVWVPIKLDANGRMNVELQYLTSLPLDRFEQPEQQFVKPAQKLDVVPGFEAVRLPVPETIMPTGLAWRGDGTLVASSLNGLVVFLRDTDGDGLEDQATRFSDDLAAPYGVAVHGDDVDVINKYALLRLSDTDGDGRADRTRTIASGWGHTDDYHDWAVGLIDDRQGGYFVALPCQQDDRSEAAAYLRGRALRLVPRKASLDKPLQYSLEEFCAGLRFPMGLALSRSGELFASDNQGNYNPFNELNHLEPGGHYGFVNKLETKRGWEPSHRDDPAIDIPHPWTRSVNGICFLDTPQGLADDEHASFGPWEGHLVGCEYDTRRLVRMSLEKVADTWQGAVYPMSIEPPAVEDGLEGPVVCAVSPNGDLYVGNMRDSGWGAGRNTGSVVRLRRDRPLPPGIAEVRAISEGFEIRFTTPLDSKRLADVKNYTASSYRRTVTPAYGGPDEDRRTEKVRQAKPADDGLSVQLSLDEMREGFVYELHVKNLLPAGKLFHPAEAHYTLRRSPR